MVAKLVEAGVGGAIGAYVVNEIVNVIDYTGTGADLLPLLSFVIIAAAVMAVLEEGM